MAENQSLVVAAIEGQLQVLRVRTHQGRLIPADPAWDEAHPLEMDHLGCGHDHHS